MGFNYLFLLNRVSTLMLQCSGYCFLRQKDRKPLRWLVFIPYFVCIRGPIIYAERLAQYTVNGTDKKYRVEVEAQTWSQ